MATPIIEAALDSLDYFAQGVVFALWLAITWTFRMLLGSAADDLNN